MFDKQIKNIYQDLALGNEIYICVNLKDISKFSTEDLLIQSFIRYKEFYKTKTRKKQIFILEVKQILFEIESRNKTESEIALFKEISLLVKSVEINNDYKIYILNQALLQDYPYLIFSRINVINILSNTKKFEEAINNYQLLISFYPDMEIFIFGMMDIYIKAKQPKQAIEILNLQKPSFHKLIFIFYLKGKYVVPYNIFITLIRYIFYFLLLLLFSYEFAIGFLVFLLIFVFYKKLSNYYYSEVIRKIIIRYTSQFFLFSLLYLLLINYLFNY